MLGCLQLGSLQPPRLLAPWALEGHPAGWGVLEGLGGSSEELGAFLFLRRGQASQKEVGPVCPWLVASDLGRATWPGLSAVPWAGAWTKPLALCPMPPILGASVSQLRRGGLCAAAPSSGHVSLCFDHCPVPWEAPGGSPQALRSTCPGRCGGLAVGGGGGEEKTQAEPGGVERWGQGGLRPSQRVLGSFQQRPQCSGS